MGNIINILILSTSLMTLSYLGIKNFFKSNRNSTVHTIQIEKIIYDLENMNYFKYVPNEILENAQNQFKERYDREQGVPSYEIDYKLLDDKRHGLDGEDNNNVNGFLWTLESLKPSIEKRGIKMDIGNYYDNFDPNTQTRDEGITINNREYIVYDNKVSINGWGESPKMFAEILNSELEIQGSDERIYLGSGGNDGYCVLLTIEQYEYFDKLFQNEWTKPLSPNDWWSLNTNGKL